MSNISKEHNQIINEIDSNLTIVKRFLGGLSNFTYLVEDKNTNEEKVFRIPGKGTAVFVNYERENHILHAIEHLNITNENLYYDLTTGYKLSSYIEGELITDDVDLEAVSELLKKVHNSNIELKYFYNHLERLAEYEKIHSNKPQIYHDLRAKWDTLYEEYLKMHLSTPCHGDSQFANIIQTTDGDLKLLDWEFAGINDFIYDIACFGNKDFNKALDLLAVYIKDEPAEMHNLFYIRLYGWRIFQCLQWFNVASYKDEINLSADLNINFKVVAERYLELAQNLLIDLNDKHLNK